MTPIIFATQASVANASYLWVYVLIGVVTLVGFAVASGRWLRRQGVRDAALNALIDPDTGVMVQLAEIRKNLQPNGKNTQGVGDIVARTEEAVAKVDRTVNRHIGSCIQAHEDLQRQIDRKQDKEAA